MQHRWFVLGSLGLLTTALAACGGSPPPAAPPKPVSAPPKPATPIGAAPSSKPTVAAVQQTPALTPQGVTDALNTGRFHYQPKGRRDPFENIEIRMKEAPAVLSVTATKLTAVVRGAVTLALVEDAKGVGYILKPGDTLGDGRVVEIGADNIVFAIAPKPGSTTNRVVLRIAAD